MANTTKCISCGKRINSSARANTSVQTCNKCDVAIKSATKPIDKKAKRKSVLWSYITGTLFIITGLGAFQIGILPALMLIFGGVLALPVVRVGLVKMSGFATDKPLIIASTVLIIFGVISYTSSVKSDRLDNIAENTSVNE